MPATPSPTPATHINIVYTTRGYAEVELDDNAMCAVSVSGKYANVDVIDADGQGTFDFDVPVGVSVSEVREASEDELSYDDCTRIMFTVAVAATTTR